MELSFSAVFITLVRDRGLFCPLYSNLVALDVMGWHLLLWADYKLHVFPGHPLATPGCCQPQSQNWTLIANISLPFQY